MIGALAIAVCHAQPAARALSLRPSRIDAWARTGGKRVPFEALRPEFVLCDAHSLDAPGRLPFGGYTAVDDIGERIGFGIVPRGE